MRRRMRAALLSVPALILGCGALLLSTAGSASADLAGTVTLTPGSGTVTDVPAFPEISVSAPCPAPYQDKVAVYLTIGGSDVLLANNVTDGAPFSGSTLTTHLPATAGASNRSIATTFGVVHKTVADGTYPLHIVCGSNDAANVDKPTFATAIEITGSTWAVKAVAPPTATSVALTTTPAGHAVVSHDVTLTATVTPGTAAGTVTFLYKGAPIGANNVPVANGTATATLPGVAAPGGATLTARFTPADPLAFGTSEGSLSYSIVDEPSLTVLDDSDNTLDGTPTLTKGQKLKVSAKGFLPNGENGNGEMVRITVDDAAAAPDVVASGTGALTNYAVTLASDIADGTHSLVLTGATSGIKQTFAFRTGGSGTPTPDPSDTGSPTPDPTGTGDDGGASDGGATDGGSTGSGTTSGTSDAGPTGGGSTSGSSSSGGSTGPLAATGAAGVVPLSVFALLMIAGGGYAAYRVRRDGKLLSFGPTPRD